MQPGLILHAQKVVARLATQVTFVKVKTIDGIRIRTVHAQATTRLTRRNAK